MNLLQLSNTLKNKEISALELTQDYLKKINTVNPDLNCYITICEDFALEQAKSAQKLIDSNKAFPLTGIPISIKDNICTKHIKTTCASKMLSDFVPDYDATVIKKLKNQGAVILGKTNMDEFAMGSASRTSCYGCTKNPYDLSKVAGGSSGGSASAVASGLCYAALGSDTGGSIRQPAAFCGVTGLKPTYGTVSRYGLIAFASSFDQIGILAKSAIDCGFLLNCIYSKDSNDLTTSDNAQGNYTKPVNLKNARIGIPKEFFTSMIDTQILNAVTNAINFYKKQGFEIVECSLPSLDFCVSAYYLLSSAEAASNLSRFDGIRFGYKSTLGDTYDELIKNSRSEAFGKEVKRRILLGNYALCENYYNDYYIKALKIASQIKKEYDEIFKKCDFIISPTTATTAYDIEKQESLTKTYLADICTVSANLAGLPAISTTCSYDENGMPIGMTLTGKAFDERTIITACDLFEKNFKRREVILQ